MPLFISSCVFFPAFFHSTVFSQHSYFSLFCISCSKGLFFFPTRPGRTAPPPTCLPPRLHTAHTDQRRRRTHRCRGPPATDLHNRHTSDDLQLRRACNQCPPSLPQCHACGGDSAAARRPPVSSVPSPSTCSAAGGPNLYRSSLVNLVL